MLAVVKAPAAEVVIEVSSELVVDDIEREGVNGRIDEHEAERDGLERVPVAVVAADVVEVPDDQPRVTRQPADRKDCHEDEYHVGHLQTTINPHRFTARSALV